MRGIIALLLLFSLVACVDKEQNTKVTALYTIRKVIENKKEAFLPVSDTHGLNKSYDLSTSHKPFLITGFFNEDKTLDTAMIVRRKATGEDALFIKHGGTKKTYFLKTGKDVSQSFENLNWIGEFKVIQKGTKIYDDVINGEIVGDDQVTESKKVLLKTDAIFMHEDEGGGGGIIYFNNGKYVWVQQD